MIRRIFSDLPNFKTLKLNSGLNVLLADRLPSSTERQTRNGAGKTSLVELVHFLMGASCRPESIFRNEVLSESSFGVDFDLGDAQVVALRSGSKPADVHIDAKDFDSWPISPARKKDGALVLSNENWKAVLGAIMFGLVEGDGKAETWSPTFRSLFPYFARRDRDGAFQSPMKHMSEQQLGTQQISLSFLVGLDWTIPQQWQQVRERERSLRELKKAAGEGTLGAAIDSVANLRTQLAVAEDRARKLRVSVASYRVLDQYHAFDDEASDITRRLGVLSDENILDNRQIKELEAAVASEVAPGPEDLEALYAEAGVALPGSVRRRFDEVQEFHASVIRNRRSYLASEMNAARQRVSERSQMMSRLDERRADIMKVLQSHGALDHFSALQTELARVESATESVRQRFHTAEALESGQVTLNIERARLLERLNRDYREQGDTLNHAILAFEEISHSLYERAGSLTVSSSPNGPEFDIQIQGAKSRGIGNMQIFCFDMTLMRLCAERKMGPGFLVHDSHIFDGVDERQVGRALEIGARLADQFGFQYIVTMNSDAVPKDVPAGFDLDAHVLPVKLTDATEDGGLFGLRFD